MFYYLRFDKINYRKLSHFKGSNGKSNKVHNLNHFDTFKNNSTDVLNLYGDGYELK